jgi:hypothetical protein
MRKIVVVIVLLSGPVSAADFRVLDVGEPCASVRDSEVASGSAPLTWSGKSPYVYAFTGQEFGREVEISYFCPHGSFLVGNYFIPERNLDDVVRSYREVYTNLNAKFGDPLTDNTPWRKANEKSHVPIPSDQSKYFVVWLSQRMNTTLSLLRSGDGTGTSWKVAIAVAPNKETREAVTKQSR